MWHLDKYFFEGWAKADYIYEDYRNLKEISLVSGMRGRTRCLRCQIKVSNREEVREKETRGPAERIFSKAG